MNIIKKLVWLVVFIPAAVQAQYYGVTPSTATGRATMRLSGQELVYASSSTTSPSIILQGNGGRISATGGITVSSATVKGNASITGDASVSGAIAAGSTLTVPYANIGTSGHYYSSVDANIFGGLQFYNSDALRIGASAGALRIHGYTGYFDIGYGANNGVNKSSPGYPLDVAGTINSDFGVRAATAAITGNATIGGTLGVTGATTMAGALTVNAAMTVSSVTVPGNVAIGTTTAQTRLNVAGGDIRVQGDSTGFGTTPTSGEGLEIAYDSVNHYAWFGAYNRTTAAYTGNYVDGSTMGLNYYSKGPVIIGGNTSAPGLALTYGVSAATATVTGPLTLGGITYTMPSTLGGPGQFLMLASTSTSAATMSFGSPSGSGDVLTTGNNTMTGTNTFSSAIVANGGVTFPDGYTQTAAGYQLYASSHTSCTNGGVGAVTSLTASLPASSNRIVINAQQYTTAGYYYLTVGSYTSGYRYSNLSWTTGTTASNSASAAYIPITNGTVSTTTGFLYAVLNEQYAGWIGGARAMHVMGQYTTYNSSSLPETGMIGGMTGGIGNTVTITVSAGKFCGSVDVYALNGSRSGY